MQRPFKLDPQRERSYEFSVSRIVRRIFFFWECSLRFFLFFAYIYEILQHGTKNDLNRIFLNNLGFLKIRKSFQKRGFLEFSQKRLLGFFLFSLGALSLIVSFSPRKYFVKKIFVQKLFQIKDARGSLLNDPLLYILYLTENEWIWLKLSKMILSWFWDELWCVQPFWAKIAWVCPTYYDWMILFL